MEIDTVLLDENFLEFTNGRPLPLTDRAKAIFHMSILNDTLFLSIINIIDYSILVGIDEEKHELVVGEDGVAIVRPPPDVPPPPDPLFAETLPDDDATQPDM